MPSLAERFFAEREVVVPDVASLTKALDPNRYLSTIVARMFGKERLPGKPSARLQWFYRGQSDASWGLSSSLYRAVRSSGPVTEHGLSSAEDRITEVMRAQGLGHHMNDAELLMVLQHHGIPTRLVDVSSGWLPALWFATEHSDTTDGRLFMIGLRNDANGGHPTLTLGEDKQLPWAGAAIGRAYSSRSWSESVMAVDDPSLDPRMRAHKGRFLVGGLSKRYAGENWPLAGEPLPAAEWPDITTLRIFFPQPGARKRASVRWPAVGWTLRIPGELKPAFRKELVKREYTRNHMYPDFDGSRRLGLFVATHQI